MPRNWTPEQQAAIDRIARNIREGRPIDDTGPVVVNDNIDNTRFSGGRTQQEWLDYCLVYRQQHGSLPASRTMLTDYIRNPWYVVMRIYEDDRTHYTSEVLGGPYAVARAAQEDLRSLRAVGMRDIETWNQQGNSPAMSSCGYCIIPAEARGRRFVHQNNCPLTPVDDQLVDLVEETTGVREIHIIRSRQHRRSNIPHAIESLNLGLQMTPEPCFRVSRNQYDSHVVLCTPGSDPMFAMDGNRIRRFVSEEEATLCSPLFGLSNLYARRLTESAIQSREMTMFLVRQGMQRRYYIMRKRTEQGFEYLRYQDNKLVALFSSREEAQNIFHYMNGWVISTYNLVRICGLNLRGNEVGIHQTYHEAEGNPYPRGFHLIWPTAEGEES